MSRCELWIEGIDEPLWVRHFHIREALSTNFACTIVARTSAPVIDIDTPIWASAVFSLYAGLAHVEGGGARQWAGVVKAILMQNAWPTSASFGKVTSSGSNVRCGEVT